MAIRHNSEQRSGDDVSTDTTCPECGGAVRTNAIETVCEDCGLLVDDQQIDHGPEWRSFDDDETTPTRTGSPLTVARHDRGLSTEIGHKKDAHGTELSGQKRTQLARLRREQARGRFQSKAERNLAHGLTEVRRIASGLGVAESIRNQACQLFRSAQNDDLLRGRSLESMAAASVFGACRCAGASRLLTEVVDLARVDASRVENAYGILNTELSLPAPPTTPTQFVPRIAAELDCPDRVQRCAQTLAKQAMEATVTVGVHPAAFAAACVYRAAHEHGHSITQATVATAANVTPATIRAHRETLREQVV
ncbi:transcription initiation factor IIB [Halorubrum trueperi]|uniref:Transcription initiation factor IIB n=1 Tax=Halorubrum trueperi TaxID=2004704 RepID=A0ABD5UFY7_9EURY